jgi:hypothetical protein
LLSAILKGNKKVGFRPLLFFDNSIIHDDAEVAERSTEMEPPYFASSFGSTCLIKFEKTNSVNDAVSGNPAVDPWWLAA